MPELITTEITQKELDDLVIPQNMVLCERYYDTEGAKTKGGIIFGVNTELTYQDADNPKDDSSHVADMAETALIVIKTPQSLYFDIDDYRSMPWETEQELCEDDLVWTNPIDSLNAITLSCGGKYYSLIQYQDLYVAKREIWVNKWEGTKKTIIVPLNGFCLLKQLFLPKLSELDVTSTGAIDKTRGEVAYIGSCNKQYKNERYDDFVDLRVGDVVLFDKKAIPVALERTSYNNQFSEDGEIFWVLQRRSIAMIIERKP